MNVRGWILVPAGIAAALALLVLAAGTTVGSNRQTRAAGGGPFAEQASAPVPTRHPAVPGQPEHVWLAPEPGTGAPRDYATLAVAAQAIADGRPGDALELLGSIDLDATPLAGHAAYYTGLAQLGLEDHGAARRTFAVLRRQAPPGHLAEAAALGEAEAAEAGEDAAAAVRIYEALALGNTAAPDDMWMRLGRAALAAGNEALAAEAFLRVYDDHPLSPLAAEAAAGLDGLGDAAPPRLAAGRFAGNLARAERLFAARRHAEARRAFEPLRAQATRDEDRALIDLRLAQCDFHLRRYTQARAGTRRFLEAGPHAAEARYYHAAALRQLGAHGDYVAEVRRLVSEHPGRAWAEEALNDLASYYIRRSEDARAEQVFRQILEAFPSGRHADRAAWRAGWWAYRRGDYADAAGLFERAAGALARADYRPAWLYWAARSREHLGQTAEARALYALTIADYGNLYHGRLAAGRLVETGAAGGGSVAHAASAGSGVSVVPAARSGAARPTVPAPPMPPTAPLIRHLLLAGLYDAALAELAFAQRTWGTSAAIEASIAYAHHRRGELRLAINTMRRAYPQFMAAGGELLPVGILRVIFPVDYWDLIEHHSQAQGLDPYLMAALVAQESTFVPDIRSPANAVGLMQIIPPTGQRIAASIGIRPFNASMLTHPETNVRLGTAYFAQLLRRFGEEHFALAGYNAGEQRVVRWRAERPGLPRDEFIEDIPFPETQGYVKRILGSAEDYRRLYGVR